MKKNIFAIFLGLIFFSFLRPTKVFAACTWRYEECTGTCTGGSCGVVGTSCQCIYPPTNTPKPPTATPTSCANLGQNCSPYLSCCSPNICSGSYGVCNAPPPTPTPCANLGQNCSPYLSCCSPNICSGSYGVCNAPSPTPVCDTSTVGGCNPLYDDGCESTCDPCPLDLDPGETVPRTKSGNCYSSDACRANIPPLGPCYRYSNLEDTFFCGWCTGGTTPMPTPTPFCQPFRCYNIPPENSICPGFTAAGCPDGLGNCDNCGGMDCGLCPGSLPPVGPTPTPGCTENCLSDPRYLTTCNNTTFGICANTIWCYGALPPDCSCATNLCNTQTCMGTCNETCTGLLTCAQTILERFEIRRNDSTWSYTDGRTPGRDITDAQNRLQICDSFLSSESPNPRSLIYVAWLDNANGCSDIDANSVKMRWLGNNTEIAMAKLASYQAGPCAYTATVTYPTNTNVASAQGFQITMKSISGGVTTPWTTVTPDLKLKVWNCQVPVSGNFYNAGANNLTCIGGGVFSNLFTGLGANSMIFKDMSPIGTPNIADVTANVSNTSYNASLLWNHTYQPIFNGGPDPNQGLKVLNRLFRGYDTGNPTPVLTCPVPDSFSQMSIVSGHEIVHPYWASPAMQLDMAFSQAMEAWFQIRGSGLRAGSNLRSGVPVTAVNQALTMGVTDKDNGLVIYNTLLGNINGNNGNNTFGYPNNWKLSGKNYKDLLNNYNYFYNNLFLKKGIGTTGNSWSQRPTGGIFFVSGDLNIDSDNTSSVNNPLLVVAKGDVNVESTVNQLNLLLMADGNINIGGTSNSQLIVNGSLYARGDIIISRDIGDIVYNTTNPAVRIDYQPTAIFSLDKEIYKVLSDWRSE